jgi:hypothetical protein
MAPDEQIGVRVRILNRGKFVKDAQIVQREIKQIGDESEQSAVKVELLNAALFRLGKQMENLPSRARKSAAGIRSINKATNADSNRGLKEYTASLSELHKEAQRVGVSMPRASTGTRTLAKDAKTARKEVRFLAGSLRGIAALTLVLAPLSAITAIGWLIQLVVVLGGAVLALSGALGPLVGALVAVPALVLTLAAAIGTVALGFTGASAAAKQMQRDLKALKPVLASTQAAAAQGMQPGVSSLFKSVGGLKSTLTQGAGQYGVVIGGLAQQLGTMLTQLNKSGDLPKLLQSSAGWMRMLGEAGLFLVKALTNILVVARPFITWMFNVIRGWGEWAKNATAAGRANGKLAEFFSKSRTVMRQVGSIIGNVVVGLFNIARAGAGLGGTMLTNLSRVSKEFRRWTESEKGRERLAQFFRDLAGPVRSVAHLVKALGGGMLQLGASTKGLGSFQGTTDAIADKLVPALVSLMQSTGGDFGPALVGSLASLAGLLAVLAAEHGPLTLLMHALTGVSTALAWAITYVPGLNLLVAGFLGLKTAMFVGAAIAGTAMKMRLLFAALSLTNIQWAIFRGALALNRGLMLVSAAATLVARGAMLLFKGALMAVRGAVWLVNLAIAANPIGLLIAVIVAAVAAFVYAYVKFKWFRDAVNAIFRNMVNPIRASWNLIKGSVTAAIKIIKSAIQGDWNGVWDGFKMAGAAAINFLIDIMNGFIDAWNSTVGQLGGHMGIPDIKLGRIGNVSWGQSSPSSSAETTANVAKTTAQSTRSEVTTRRAAAVQSRKAAITPRNAVAPIIDGNSLFNVESHTTVELDGEKVGKSVSKGFTKAKARQ